MKQALKHLRKKKRRRKRIRNREGSVARGQDASSARVKMTVFVLPLLKKGGRVGLKPKFSSVPKMLPAFCSRGKDEINRGLGKSRQRI